VLSTKFRFPGRKNRPNGIKHGRVNSILVKVN